MKLSSARELKQSMMDTMRTSHREIRTFSMQAAGRSRTIRQSAPIPVAAIGIAPQRGRRRNFHIALRIYKGQDRRARRMMQAYARHEGEIDIVRGVEYQPRQLSAGGSCGHFRITAGTLGAFVENSDSFFMLSNNHVFADSDNASIGDPIVQPGPADIVGNNFDIIGQLHSFASLASATVDAALASFSDDIDFFNPWFYDGIGEIDPNHVTDRFSVTEVVKLGRTTGLTQGRVTVFELDGVAIDYGPPNGVVTFNNQIEVTGDPPSVPFSNGGDSGSLIIARNSLRPYALLYGGGPDATGIDRTVAHFIPDVLNQLGVSFVT